MFLELRKLYPKSAKHLMWSVFLRDSMLGMKLWLTTGYGALEMPLPMLFFANESGLAEKSFVVERMKYAHGNIMFLPEQIEMECDVDSHYTGICYDEFVRALRIIRCRHVLAEGKIKYPKLLDSQVLSRRIRTQAAILSDDKGWLGALATEPDFVFSSEQLSFAARYGSIACFRFISINGAEYKQNVIEAAVYGGNEEIIQMCLEHGCDVRTEEVMRQSARGCQTKIFEWLVDVHEMNPTADVVVTALMSGCYDIVVRFGSILNESHTIKYVKWNDSVLPRNDDFRHFVVHLLDDPCIHPDLKASIMRDKHTILYCDDANLATKCGVDIYCFESILFAAQNDSTDILMAISQNEKIDIMNDRKETTLITCVCESNLSGISSLVDNGANMEALDKYGRTALMCAASNGHIDTVRYLVEHGANIKFIDTNGWTVLTHAAMYGGTDTVKYLVELGANVEAVDTNDKTSLMYAAWNGRMGIVKYLVEHGANVDAVDKYGWTALIGAGRSGRTETVKYLVELGANVEAADKNGLTPLTFAAKYGHTDTVKYLVEHGANVEAVDKDGWTALMHAANNGRIDTVKYLVEHGANVKTVGKNGCTALILAGCNGHTDIVKYLVDQGANVNAHRNDAWTVLMLATENGHAPIVKYLVEHGANVEAVDENGWTALMHAAKYGCTDALTYLIEHGVNVKAVDKNSWAALMIAASRGRTDTGKDHVEHGVNVEAVDQYGQTTSM